MSSSGVLAPLPRCRSVTRNGFSHLTYRAQRTAGEQAFPLFRSQMFNPLNVTIVLSSLELWAGENKIPTAGQVDDLLKRFLEWKQSILALQSHDTAYLLV